MACARRKLGEQVQLRESPYLEIGQIATTTSPQILVTRRPNSDVIQVESSAGSQLEELSLSFHDHFYNNFKFMILLF